MLLTSLPFLQPRQIFLITVGFVHKVLSILMFSFPIFLLLCLFSVFLLTAGVAEKTQLLKLSVPATFMLVSLDEGPGPPIKYQYAELGKLYSVVSQLIRCCNVSSRMQSSINGNVFLAVVFEYSGSDLELD